VDSVELSSLVQQAAYPGALANTYGFNDLDPALLFSALPFRTRGNSTRFQSDAYSMRVDSALREPDAEKRVDEYRDIARFVHDQAFVLPLADQVLGYGVKIGITGLAFSTAGEPLFADVRM
jgi:ABC-type transport system substrate-binding protein